MAWRYRRRKHVEELDTVTVQQLDDMEKDLDDRILAQQTRMDQADAELQRQLQLFMEANRRINP